jgi:hypothetical protein
MAGIIAVDITDKFKEAINSEFSFLVHDDPAID